MSAQRLFLAIYGAIVLTAVAAQAGAQVSEQTAREQTRSAVRSRLHLKPDQFLQVRRDEEMEQSLAAMVGKSSVFIYRVSQAGDEVKEHSVIHHIFTDVDPSYIVAVNAADGSVYRIHGFTDSKAEFDRLMTTLTVKISSPDQAEAVADFYRTVNPERREITPISGLLALKQAAEWQCQAVPFDPSEKDFEAWWKHEKPLYSEASFKQIVAHNDGGYAVEWIVLSSPGAGLCGGAPLRARLEVGSDGRVGEITFVPLKGAVVSREASHAQGTSVP